MYVCVEAYHLKSPSQHANQNIGEPQLILRPSIIRQLHEIGQRVLIKHQRELLVIAGPVRNRRCDVQEHFEADLKILP